MARSVSPGHQCQRPPGTSSRAFFSSAFCDAPRLPSVTIPGFPGLDLTNWTSLVTALVAHAILWVGLGGTFVLVIQVILRAEGIERLLRAAAFLSAPLLLLTGGVLGLSLPETIYSSLSNTNPFGVGLFGLVLPAGLGMMVAWIFVRGLRRSEDVAVRVMILVSTAVLFEFAEVYRLAVTQSQKPLGANLLPNATFTLGLFLYSILYYKPKEAGVPDTESNPLGALFHAAKGAASAIGRARSGVSADTPAPSEAGK